MSQPVLELDQLPGPEPERVDPADAVKLYGAPAVAGEDINQQNIRARTQRGGTRPGAGRPPGSKNKKLSVKGPRTDRVIVALSGCASSPANIKKSRRGIERMAPAKAPEGIAPKDVLLTSMRNAWELAHQKAAL